MVYGDTDSVFVHLKGRSIESAFAIGKEIAEEITLMYPYPISLKFEKVYQSLILSSKKRYVGYKIEKLGEKPVLEAKGIETVRRDTCDAASKILAKTLKLLFTTKDLSKVKTYLQRKWAKIQ